MSKKSQSYYDPDPVPEVADEEVPAEHAVADKSAEEKAAEIKKYATACHDEMYGPAPEGTEVDVSPYDQTARFFYAMTHANDPPPVPEGEAKAA